MTKQNIITHHKDVKLSINFGFLGLGMGGSSIAAVCGDVKTNASFPYKALLVNTNSMDLDKIKVENESTVKLLIGDGKGASRDINRGEEIFVEHANKVADSVNLHFVDRDFIWVVAGLGGGTGTGSIIQAIKVLMTNNFQKKFGLILTLPRDSEGSTVLSNALERLQVINKAMQGLGSVVIVDNQKLFNYFETTNSNATVQSYLSFANSYIADTLHGMNVVTSSYQPYGEFHFDSSEFKKLITTPGVLHFVKYETKVQSIDVKKPIEHLNTLQKQIVNGVLSDGYNLAKTSRLALSILAHSNSAHNIFNIEFTKSIEDLLSEIAPIVSEKPVGQYIYPFNETSKVYYYAAFAGLDLPSRVRAMIEENNRVIKAKKNLSTEKVEDIFSNFVTTNPATKESTLNGDEEFARLFNQPIDNDNEKDGQNEGDKAFAALFGDK
ncbi:plasmid replication protein [Viridibacillus sp. NPDC096237]|uniref:plasmid replication protein n=1 Tax=Viridibacillus sp. NPDC096237 TaxID=3390721 RepID=UPI003D06E363